MKTHNGETFHGQTLWYIWNGGMFHVEVCHFPTIDTEHMIWSKCPRTGAKISYGTVDRHFSSLDAAARFVLHAMEAHKLVLDREIAKWKSVIDPPPPPSRVRCTHLVYSCHHLTKHEGLLSLDPYETAWRRWFDDRQWPRHGYCYLYYPQYVREAWARDRAPTYAEGI